MTLLASLALVALMSFQNDSFAVNETRVEQNVTSYGNSTVNEPSQKDSSPFKTMITLPGGDATLTSDASYLINAKVESIRSYDDTISALVPIDMLLAWGEMARNDIDSKLVWDQGDRKGQVSGTLGSAAGVDLDNYYVITHVSNNHLIPANERIERAIRNIKTGDTVRIQGRLVDIREKLSDGRVVTVNTSKTRSDQGEGACEIIFIEQLSVNGRPV